MGRIQYGASGAVPRHSGAALVPAAAAALMLTFAGASVVLDLTFAVTVLAFQRESAGETKTILVAINRRRGAQSIG